MIWRPMEQVKLAAPGTPRANASQPRARGTDRSVRRSTTAPALLSFAVIVATAAPAAGAPLLDPRQGGIALVGPASAHPGSFLYNPAAQGLLPRRVFATFLDTTLRLGHGAVQRTPIDTRTGLPSDSSAATVKRFGEEGLLEVFPHPLLGLSSTFGSESVVISLSSHTAGTQRISFNGHDRRSDGGALGATRYAGTDLTQYHIHGTLTASWHIASFLVFGASASVVWGSMDLGFARDGALDGGQTRDGAETVAIDDCGDGSACGYEADRAAEAVRVSGSGWGFGFAVGVVVRPIRSLDIGVAYVGPVLAFNGQSLMVEGDAWIRRSQASMDNAQNDPRFSDVERDLSGRGTVHYTIPDAVNLGVTWRVTPRLRLNAQLRWIDYSSFLRLSIRLRGTMLRKQPAVPERVDHHRGFQDVWIAQVGGGFALTEGIEVQTALMLETSAVPETSVTPLTIDSNKVDWLAALTWRINPYLTFRAGYSLSVMPGVDVEQSNFNPGAMVRCVDSGYDIDLTECRAAADGRGLPSTAGRYWLLSHRLGTSLTLHLE